MPSRIRRDHGASLDLFDVRSVRFHTVLRSSRLVAAFACVALSSAVSCSDPSASAGGAGVGSGAKSSGGSASGGSAGWAGSGGSAGGSAGAAVSDAGGGAPTDGGGWGGGGPDADAQLPDADPPQFVGLRALCKLISNRNLGDPTANDTHHRFNLTGTDLGIPVKHGSDLFFFFGDTAGYAQIWPLGPESLPDAVGYSAVPAHTVASAPDKLCSGLRFLALEPSASAGPGADPSVQRDFAAAWMNPPPGRDISEFIHNPSGPRGKNMFPNMPGDFEVPSGAFSHGSSIYVYYTTVQLEPFGMKGSYLARWTSPSTTGLPVYDILYHVDQRFDGNGALRGNFVNIAPVVAGNYVYLFGTGEYRQSAVHLARKALATLETEGGYESFDAASGTWVAGNAPAAPVVESNSIGELSVQYFPGVNRYVMLDQEIAGGNFVMARFANRVEGPWSAPIPVAQMEDPAFGASYCCVGGDCQGDRMFNCGSAGFYGTYMLPDAITNPDGSFSIAFTMSTWNPYNVALMQATFD